MSPGKLFLANRGFIPANPFLSFRSTPRKLFLGDPFGAAPVKLFEHEGEAAGIGLAPVKLFSSSSGFVPGKLLLDSESEGRLERVEPASEGRREPEMEGRREEKGVEAAEDSADGAREVPREEVGVFLALEDLSDLGFFSKSLELWWCVSFFCLDGESGCWRGSTYNMVACVSGDSAWWLFVCIVTVFVDVVGITESERDLWSSVLMIGINESIQYSSNVNESIGIQLLVLFNDYSNQTIDGVNAGNASLYRR